MLELKVRITMRFVLESGMSFFSPGKKSTFVDKHAQSIEDAARTVDAAYAKAIEQIRKMIPIVGDKQPALNDLKEGLKVLVSEQPRLHAITTFTPMKEPTKVESAAQEIDVPSFKGPQV